MTNNFGIPQKYMGTIQHIFADFPEIEKVFVFGSRAMGNYKETSDIDFAIDGKKVSFGTVASLKERFTESSLPYFTDIVLLPKISSKELKQHIAEHGIPLSRATAHL